MRKRGWNEWLGGGEKALIMIVSFEGKPRTIRSKFGQFRFQFDPCGPWYRARGVSHGKSRRGVMRGWEDCIWLRQSAVGVTRVGVRAGGGDKPIQANKKGGGKTARGGGAPTRGRGNPRYEPSQWRHLRLLGCRWPSWDQNKARGLFVGADGRYFFCWKRR